jgi:hypothetical protein
MRWQQDERLYIGNEATRDRSWLGEIRYVGIYGRALTAEQRQLAHATLDVTRDRSYIESTKLLIGYNFMHKPDGRISPEGLLNSPDLTLELPGNCSWGGEGTGVLLAEPALIASRGPASALTNAILSSEAFTIEAWVRPLSEDQGGPARIVSLSENAYFRNFTLGQQNADLVFRVRNGINGENGRNRELHSRGALGTKLQHIIATYDHGVSSVFRDGELAPPVIDLREPVIYLGLGATTYGRLAAGLLLTIMIALPVTALWSKAGRHITRFGAALLTLAIGSLPYAVACLKVGGPWRLELFFCLAISLTIAYPLCFLYVAKPGLTSAGRVLVWPISSIRNARLKFGSDRASEGVF